MIQVKRPTPTPDLQAVLARRSQKSKLSELEAALWYFENIKPDLDPMPAKPGEAPEFAAYSDKAVKDALHTAFDGHCAYCESRYEQVAPMDVEHYRPKGGVIDAGGKLRKPGYYWLAAAWDNLLPSCIGCNRAREQPQQLADGSVVQATTGKANLFPLLAGTVHATASGGEKAEKPLLLDPCRDDPRPHLLFRSDGYVEPRASPEESAAARGFATIEVCGLYRAALVEARRKAATRLRDAMDAILSADHDCRLHPGEAFYLSRLARRENSLNVLVADLDYRALTGELTALFAEARAAIADYRHSESAWEADRSPANRAAFVKAARALVTQHGDAGLHQPFVTELYGLADIPLDRL